jgi:hypothetical protein
MTLQILHHTSFDEGFEPYQGEQHLIGPVGWGIDWQPGDKPGPVRPEVQAEIRSRGDRGILTGEHGVKMCHAYAFFDGVFYRRFAAEAGLVYRAQVHATAECPEGGLACQIGIDPAGDLEFLSKRVVWSKWYGTDDSIFQAYRWQLIASEVEAQANQITVFLRCTAREAVHVNAGFFDDFTLFGQASAPPAPGPDTGTLTTHIERLAADVAELAVYVDEHKRPCLVVT